MIKEIRVRYVLLGNYFIALLVCSVISICAEPECGLEVRNTDGAVVSMVGSGVPFQLVVTVRDCAEQPQVQFDESPFTALRRVSVQTRMVNGYSSVSYVYSARIDTMGTYEIGPARVAVKGATYTTNTIQLEVGKQEKTVGSRFMMQTTIDDSNLYVGQQSTFRMRILSTVGKPEVATIHLPRIDNVVVGEFTVTDTGSEYHDGIKYWYKEFTASLYAQKTGNFLIPACSADVHDDQARRSSFFFFSAIASTKQIYSNTVALTVRDIPVHSKPYALIGEYTHAVATAEPEIVELGQAVRYRLTVYGEGNNAQCKAPLLSDIPSGCKYYDSSVIPLEGNAGVIFEYVIQPRQPGTWEIPVQEVVYFDPSSECFSTLYTDAVTITANPSATDQNSVAPESNEPKNDAQELQKMALTQRYHDDLSSADPIPYHCIYIPWFWYWLLTILLLIICMVSLLFWSMRGMYLQQYAFFKRKRAFAIARRALYALERGKKESSLYQIFVTLFAQWFMVSESEITEAFIKTHILAVGILSDDGLESWERFWHTIVQEQYGGAVRSKINKTIYTEARLWITAFSKFGIQ